MVEMWWCIPIRRSLIKHFCKAKDSLAVHVRLMHFSVSVAAPLQFLPPFAGLGELHWRDLLLVPLSHDFEHADHEDQLPQNPSTGSTEKITVSQKLWKGAQNCVKYFL